MLEPEISFAFHVPAKCPIIHAPIYLIDTRRAISKTCHEFLCTLMFSPFKTSISYSVENLEIDFCSKDFFRAEIHHTFSIFREKFIGFVVASVEHVDEFGQIDHQVAFTEHEICFCS